MRVPKFVENLNAVIYVIDPDQKLRSQLVKLFQRTGFDAVCYASAEEFLDAEQELARFGCIVSRQTNPVPSGVSVSRAVQRVFRGPWAG